MNSEKRYQLEELLKEFQNDLIEKAQDNKYENWARIKWMDNAKLLLQALAIIQEN